MFDDLKYFYENYDFDMVFDWTLAADWVEVFSSPVIFGPIAVLLILLFIPKTSFIAQGVIVYLPVVGFFFVAATVLHNDDITNVGPFILALISFFMVVGWFLYTKMLKS